MNFAAVQSSRKVEARSLEKEKSLELEVDKAIFVRWESNFYQRFLYFDDLPVLDVQVQCAMPSGK